MKISAITMMAISILLLWGGLMLAIIHLMRHPDHEDDEEDEKN